MAFEIIVHEAAVEELEAWRVFDQRKLVAAIGEQLSFQPTVTTGRRKCLGSLAAALKMFHPFGNSALAIFEYFTMWMWPSTVSMFALFAARNRRKRRRT
jgi:hypothetical protein